MPGIAYREITAQEIGGGDPGNLNRLLQEMVEEINRLGGLNGPIEVFNQFNMLGNRICDVGEPESDTDVATKGSSSSDAVSAAQTAMEITGSNQLQGVRRLNDDRQRERKSTYMNEIGSTPPHTNTSTIIEFKNNGDTTITVSAGTATLADGSTVQYAQREDTFDNPSGSEDFYYYYLRLSDKTLQVHGTLHQFNENTSANQFAATTDGRQFIGTANVADGGGVGGGGGGGGEGGGCAEVGSLLMFPHGSQAHMTVEDCCEWSEIRLEGGQFVAVHPRTLVSVFKRAEDVDVGDLVEVENGKVSKVVDAQLIERESVKMNVHIPNGGTYFAGGVRVHNSKQFT